MNKVYGFEGECKAKHGEMTYKLFADVFTACELGLSPKRANNPQCLLLLSCLPVRNLPISRAKARSLPSCPPKAISGISLSTVDCSVKTVSHLTMFAKSIGMASSLARKV
jgi:serine/threonine-protein phosphatase 5